MRFWKLATSAPRPVNSLACVAAGSLVFKIVVLNRFSSLFPGAYRLGLIFEGLLASIIASYVFYLVVVRFKEQSDFQALYPYVSKHSKIVVRECSDQLKDISKEAGRNLDLVSVDEKSIEEAFKNISPHSQAPLVLDQLGTYANWFQYFHYHRERSLRSVRKLFDQLKFLEAEHIILVTSVDDCSHFAMLDILQSLRVKNSDLSAWAKTFYSYCVCCRELEFYNRKLDRFENL